MKTNPFISSQARKTRKHFFNATKEEKHVAMSAPLSKELRQTHNIKRLPIRREDEVEVVRGKYKSRAGKIVDVKVRTMRVHVESVTVSKLNNETVYVPLHPSNLVITKLKMDKNRKAMIDRRREGREKVLAKLSAK